jgi:hypothetical protein
MDFYISHGFVLARAWLAWLARKVAWLARIIPTWSLDILLDVRNCEGVEAGQKVTLVRIPTNFLPNI